MATKLKLGTKPLTGYEIELIRESLGLTVLDFGWLLGMDHAKYHRVVHTPGKAVEGAGAGIARYVFNHFPDYPFHVVIREDKYKLASVLLKNIKEACRSAEPIIINGLKLNPDEPQGLAALLFASVTMIKAYERDRYQMPLTGARWGTLLLYCLQSGKTKLISEILEDQAKAQKRPITEIISDGW